MPWLPYGVPHALLTDTAAAQFLLKTRLNVAFAIVPKINVSLAQIEGLELAGYLTPGTELSEALEQFFSDSISEWLQT